MWGLQIFEPLSNLNSWRVLTKLLRQRTAEFFASPISKDIGIHKNGGSPKSWLSMLKISKNCLIWENILKIYLAPVPIRFTATLVSVDCGVQTLWIFLYETQHRVPSSAWVAWWFILRFSTCCRSHFEHDSSRWCCQCCNFWSCESWSIWFPCLWLKSYRSLRHLSSCGSLCAAYLCLGEEEMLFHHPRQQCRLQSFVALTRLWILTMIPILAILQARYRVANAFDSRLYKAPWSDWNLLDVWIQKTSGRLMVHWDLTKKHAKHARPKSTPSILSCKAGPKLPNSTKEVQDVCISVEVIILTSRV